MALKTCTVYTTCDGFSIKFDMLADPEWSLDMLENEAYKRFDTSVESVDEIRFIEWR